MTRLALIGLLLALAAPAWAAEATIEDPDIARVRTDYDYGKFQDSMDRAQSRIDRGELTEEQLIELHKYAGLSAFNLKKTDDAERHFAAVLRLNPDYELDPFVYTPLAIQAFEALRKKMTPELDAIRQVRRVRLERLRQDQEARDKQKREEEEQRRRIEELSRKVTIKNIEHRSILLNFAPFGAGQFQQDRIGLGTTLAVAEGMLLATNIISAVTQAALRVNQCDPMGPGLCWPRGGIPPSRAIEMRNWQYAQYASAAGLFIVYSYGVTDALYHHVDTVEIDTTESIPPEGTPETPAPAPPAKPPPPAREKKKDTIPVAPQVRGSLSLFPTPGGIGAGLTFHF